jgi:fatty-acyl-CoA synthase
MVSYGDVDARVDGFANYLTSVGLGCHTERDQLAGHESGQAHLGIYLRNGNEYLEAMIGSYRARVAPFNVSYRYVEDELLYLLTNSASKALVYPAEFAPGVAAIRDRLPHLRVLIQVADHSGHGLLPGAVDYETILATPTPAAGLPIPSGDDLYVLYTGGTMGMPKGVLWRQHDIYLSSMGGRPWGSDQPLSSYDELAEKARASAGAMALMLVLPLMHGAGQWAAFNALTMPVVGDAIVRPLLDEIEAATTTCRACSPSPTAAHHCHPRCASAYSLRCPI